MKMRVAIVGVGRAKPGIDLPGQKVTNEKIVEMLLSRGALKPGSDRPWTPEELTPQRITDLVGIKTRQWVSPDQNTSDLAVLAAEAALRAAQIGWEDIGVLVVGSSTPETIFPSIACLVLDKIGKKKIAAGEWTEDTAKRKLRIPAYDVLAACTSSLYAVDIVRKTLLSEDSRSAYGLALGAEVLSRIIDFSDTNSDLYGDAAGAVVLKRAQSRSGIICSDLGSDPWGAELIYGVGMGIRLCQRGLQPNIYMMGHEVQKYVLKIVPELITKTLENANSDPQREKKIKLEDISLFICHQANARIFEYPAKKLNIPIEKFYVNVDRWGNCSSASVLVALSEALDEGRIQKGDLIMLMGFGSGLTWASMLVEW